MFPKGDKPVSITLFKNVPFDNSYTDHVFRPEFKKSSGGVVSSIPSWTMGYFLQVEDENGQRYYPSYSLSGEYNFPYGNGINTSIVLEIPSAFTTANYMMVTSDVGVNQKVFYFFINNVTELNAEGNNVTCRYELELDVIATYDGKIMDALKDYPLLTQRKHCQRFGIHSNKTIPYCTDLATNEEIFAGLKPTQVKDVHETTLDLDLDDYPYFLKSRLNWMYVMVDTSSGDNVKSLNVKGTSTFKPVICVPLCKTFNINVNLGSSTLSDSYNVQDFVNDIWDNPSTLAVKISPYPPFTTTDNHKISFGYTTDMDGNIDSLTLNTSGETISSEVYVTKIGNNSFQWCIWRSRVLPFLNEENDTYISTIKRYLISFGYKPTTTTLRNIDYEPKMKVPPIKKYVIKTQYSDGSEVYPYLVFSHIELQNVSGLDYSLKTYKTSYPLDLTFSTYINFPDYNMLTSNGTYYYNKQINNGAISTAQYSYPTGVDATKYFTQTQGTSFVTGKIAQGVAGALAIAGGIAMGGATGGTSAIAGTKMGIAIAGGTLSITNAIAGAGAKYTDLANTPDAINGNGSSIIHDLAVGNTLQPYVVEYGLDATLEDIVLDYFYDYGYNVQRCCRFNQLLNPVSPQLENWIDERLFTRTTFNYIKLGEDIKNKLAKGDFVVSVRNKISEIFNNGIKLWTFFNKDEITHGEIDNYLFKNTYENVENY